MADISGIFVERRPSSVILSCPTQLLARYTPASSRPFDAHIRRLRSLAFHALPVVSPPAILDSSQLQAALRGYLPSQLHAYIPGLDTDSASAWHKLLAYLPDPLADQLARATPAVLVPSLLLPLLLIYILMSNWGASFGRYSPFSRQAFHAPPVVSDGDYHYISENDIVEPPSQYEPDYYLPNGNRPQRPDEEEPDVLILKHRRTTYPLHFPAFSIGENLRVGTVRRAAADATNTRDPRRIRLLYKNKKLRDDTAYTRDAGLKQNSELTCIVSETPEGARSSDDESATDDERQRTEPNGGVRINPPMGNPRKPQRPKQQSPNGNQNLRPTPDSSQQPRRPSPSPSPRPFDPNLPAATGPAALALKQIADLDNKYRREVSGSVEKLLSKPPSDTKTRDYEVIRLIEILERDYMLKADAIETEGRDDVRTKRKALIKELSQVLARLDAAKKQWASSI